MTNAAPARSVDQQEDGRLVRCMFCRRAIAKGRRMVISHGYPGQKGWGRREGSVHENCWLMMLTNGRRAVAV